MLKEILFKNYEDLLSNIDWRVAIRAILLITVLAYSPVFFYSEFLEYDDKWYIYENTRVINFSWQSFKDIFINVKAGQYSPLGEVYHMILYVIFGKNAILFKVCALLIHLVNVFLLFKILSSLFKNKILVVFVVLVFGIHPMQVELIGWLSAVYRNSVCLIFLGYLFYVRYLENGFKKIQLLPVFVCYILACLTKEQAILFPVGIFLINMVKFNYIFDKRIIIEILLWVLFTFIFGLITIKITKTGGPDIVYRHVDIREKLEMFFYTISKYISNFLFPYKLSFTYPYPIEKPVALIATMLLSVFFLISGVFLSIKNNIFRFGFLWFLGFISLSIGLSFLNVRDYYMANRFAYVAVIGFAFMFYFLLKYLNGIITKKAVVNVFIICFFALLSVLTFTRISNFHNSKLLWSSEVNVNPLNYYAFNHLGNVYLKESDFEKASECFSKAIKINNKYSSAYNNMGFVFGKMKQNDSALYYFSKAINNNPNSLELLRNRACIYRDTNNKKMLLTDLEKILALEPNNIKFVIERLQLLFELKKYSKVEIVAKQALKDFKISYLYYIIGHSNLLLKDYKEANSYMDQAIKLEESNGKYYYIRSLCRFRSGDLPKALKDAADAQKLGYKVNKKYLKGLMITVNKLLKK